jgi:hypothetical protein
MYEAPSFFDNEFFTYLLLQRILADRPETELELEIMKSKVLLLFRLHIVQIPKTPSKLSLHSKTKGLFQFLLGYRAVRKLLPLRA